MSFLQNVSAQLIVKYSLPDTSLPTDAVAARAFLESLLSLAASREVNRPVVIVVDGSESWLWHRVDAAFGTGVLHLRVDPTLAFLNGKVAGVTTGVHAASHEFVVIADDAGQHDENDDSFSKHDWQLEC